MSIWREIEKEYLSLSEDKKEIEILYKSDIIGNYYLTIKVKDVLELLNTG